MKPSPLAHYRVRVLHCPPGVWVYVRITVAIASALLLLSRLAHAQEKVETTNPQTTSPTAPTAKSPLAPPQAQQTPVVTFTKRPLQAVLLTGEPPKIDGDLSDPAWKTAAKADVFLDLQTGRVAPDQTTVYVLYDKTAVYLGFDCQDSEPQSVVGRDTVRDSLYQNGGGNEDFVEVLFDSFLTYKRGDFSRFAVNALGTRSARFGGGRASKAEWNGAWEAASRRTATGWSAEMRIPWSTFNHPSGSTGKKLNMGINFKRFQYRTRVESVWSNTGQQDFDEFEGRWSEVEVPRSSFKPTLSLLPYLLPSSDIHGKGSGDDRPQVRAGLDARYTITPELTSVSSITPDFATIEGAIQSISFSRSERYVPERRPFFLEGGGFFGAGTDYAFGPFFYSNRIPVFDGGTKLFGKITPRDTVGILAASRWKRRTDIVAKWRRDLAPTAQVSLFTTIKDYNRDTRDPNDTDDHNRVLALLADGRRGKAGAELQLAGTSGTDAGGKAGDLNLTYSDTNHFTSFQIQTIDKNFRDANGLIYFTDFKGFNMYHNTYREWRGKKPGFRLYNIDFSPQLTWHQNNKPFQRGANLGVYLETRSDIGMSVNLNYNRFDDQTDHTIGFFFGVGQSNRFKRAGIRVTTGTQADTGYKFIGPSFSLRTFKKLDLIYEGGLQYQNGQTQQHILTINYELSPTRSIGGRVVRVSTARHYNIGDNTNIVPGTSDTNFYLSYRNSGEKGTEIYLILGDPNAQRFKSRIALKFIFAL